MWWRDGDRVHAREHAGISPFARNVPLPVTSTSHEYYSAEGILPPAAYFSSMFLMVGGVRCPHLTHDSTFGRTSERLVNAAGLIIYVVLIESFNDCGHFELVTRSINSMMHSPTRNDTRIVWLFVEIQLYYIVRLIVLSPMSTERYLWRLTIDVSTKYSISNEWLLREWYDNMHAQSSRIHTHIESWSWTTSASCQSCKWHFARALSSYSHRH